MPLLTFKRWPTDRQIELIEWFDGEGQRFLVPKESAKIGPKEMLEAARNAFNLIQEMFADPIWDAPADFEDLWSQLSELDIWSIGCRLYYAWTRSGNALAEHLQDQVNFTRPQVAQSSTGDSASAASPDRPTPPDGGMTS